MWKLILAVLVVGVGLAACETDNDGGNVDSSGGDTDTDTDTDADTDTDSDTDADTDADSDSDSDADTDTDTDTDTVINDECADIDYDIEIKPINVLILLDRSRSMLLNSIDDQTFAQVTEQAINTVVTAYDDEGSADKVNFGLAAFPSPLCTCPDEDPNGECSGDDITANQCKPAQTTGDPETDMPLVAIGPDNSTAIADDLATIGTCGGTPICESFQWALEYLLTLPENLAKNPTYVLLATDGAPNCREWGPYPITTDNCQCTLPAGTPCSYRYQCLDDQCTYNWAAQLDKANFKTFVVGVGNEVADWQEVLNTTALWGGTEQFYPATDPQQLQETLQNIINELIPCDFEVDWEQVPDTGPNGGVEKNCGSVRVYGIDDPADITDDDVLEYAEDCAATPDGWYWRGLEGTPLNDLLTKPLNECTVIELCDGACNKLQTGVFQEVSAAFGCSPVII
ncbi:MAG: VWA domain-containing protein [Myxococcota bacterium]|nr:VWA domain-containing protein [Myxococcota bacterium]